jgi:hypothetical protein
MSGPKSVHNAQYEWTTNGGRSQGCEMTVDIFIFILGGTVRRHDKYDISGMTHHRFKAVVIPPWR